MGFLFGLLNLQFDFIQRIWQTFLLEAADKWSAIPCYYAATRVSHSWGGWGCNFNWSRPCHTTYALLMWKTFHLLHQHLFFIPVSHNLTSELWSSGPAEAAHEGAGAPFSPMYKCKGNMKWQICGMARGPYDVFPGRNMSVVSMYAPDTNTITQLSRTPRTLNTTNQAILDYSQPWPFPVRWEIRRAGLNDYCWSKTLPYVCTSGGQS